MSLVAFGCAESTLDEQVLTQPSQVVATTSPATTVPLADFRGMWGFEPGDEHDDARVCGYLVIEYPYVRVIVTETAGGRAPDSDIEPGLNRDDDGNLDSYWINLPRSGTRYDQQARSLWVWEQGPMTDGDHVAVGGSGGTLSTAGAYNSYERNPWLANSMEPAERPC